MPTSPEPIYMYIHELLEEKCSKQSAKSERQLQCFSFSLIYNIVCRHLRTEKKLENDATSDISVLKSCCISGLEWSVDVHVVCGEVMKSYIVMF